LDQSTLHPQNPFGWHRGGQVLKKITTGSNSLKQKVVWWLPGAGGRGK